MHEGTRDFPGSISYDEIDIINKRGNYAIAIEKGQKMYGPELALLNHYFLILYEYEYAYRIDNSFYERILESDFDEKVIKDAISFFSSPTTIFAFR